MYARISFQISKLLSFWLTRVPVLHRTHLKNGKCLPAAFQKSSVQIRETFEMLSVNSTAFALNGYNSSIQYTIKGIVLKKIIRCWRPIS
jgi:hypothetical protein